MDERINILPFNGSNDTATAMAMMNNNPWMEKTDKSIEMPPYYNKCALYVTMCMIDSDSGKTIKGIETNEEKYFDIVYSLAIDKLLDRDGVFNIRHYFCELL